MSDDSLKYLNERYAKCVRANKLHSLKSKIFGENKSIPRYKTYAGRTLLGVEDSAKLIYDGIMGDKPFLACRFGSVELELLVSELFEEGGKAGALKENAERGAIYTNAGFFPRGDISALKKFAALLKESTALADFIGVWYNPMEDYVIERFAGERTSAGVLRGIEPWYSSFKWTAALKDKKVIVIHPFADTITAQYARKDKLFSDGTLPEFSLTTIKAVQTIGDEKDDRFTDWLSALDYMYNKAMDIDFDVAIVGCGAYGMPLAAKIKAGGKKAVHMGGATQLLFGIKGRRWDNHPVIKQLYNEYWARPSASEVPPSASRVENGCYW